MKPISAYTPHVSRPAQAMRPKNVMFQGAQEVKLFQSLGDRFAIQPDEAIQIPAAVLADPRLDAPAFTLDLKDGENQTGKVSYTLRDLLVLFQEACNRVDLDGIRRTVLYASEIIPPQLKAIAIRKAHHGGNERLEKQFWQLARDIMAGLQTLESMGYMFSVDMWTGSDTGIAFNLEDKVLKGQIP